MTAQITGEHSTVTVNGKAPFFDLFFFSCKKRPFYHLCCPFFQAFIFEYKKGQFIKSAAGGACSTFNKLSFFVLKNKCLKKL
jgi:hypothetical protein